MLGFFRTNQFAANLLLLFYVFLLRSAAFIVPQDWAPTQPGMLSDWVYSLVGTVGWTPDTLAALLVFVQAFMINGLVAKFRMAKEITLFPGLFYALFASCMPEFLHLTPQLLANTFYILAFFELFSTYKKLSVATWLFNLGLWLSVASLFYFSYAILILFALVGVAQLRAFRLKELLMIITGCIIPYYLAVIYFFFTDSLPVFQPYFVNKIGLISFSWEQDGLLYAKLIFIGLIVLTALTSFGIYNQKKGIQIQKYISILFWALFISGISLLFQSSIVLEHLLILMPVLAILISFNFLNFRNNSTGETLHLLLLFVVLVFQYSQVIW